MAVKGRIPLASRPVQMGLCTLHNNYELVPTGVPHAMTTYPKPSSGVNRIIVTAVVCAIE